MTSFRKFLAIIAFSSVAACTSEVPMQNHVLRVFAVDNEGINWITQNDIDSAQKSAGSSGEVLRLHLKPEAAQRVLALTGANIGKMVRFTWDGKFVSEMRVQGAFGNVVELPAPPI